MRTIKSSNVFIGILCMMAFAGLTSCDQDTVEWNGGSLPDKEILDNTHGLLRSNKAPQNQLQLLFTDGYNGEQTEEIFYQVTQPATEAVSLDMRVDESLVGAYNLEHETTFKPLPEANYKFTDGKTFSVDVNGTKSESRHILFKAEGLAVGEYLLPVTIAEQGAEPQSKWETVYYRVKVREPQLTDHELNTETVFMVGYIDVSIYQPLLVNDYYMYKQDNLTTFEQVWYRTIGNLINLSKATLSYDSTTRRALLNLGSDMRYVLDHATKYILPLQENGRKVCISIEGGGSGVGFCNLTDAQIADFAAQVKAVVDTYGIDGVNLWDRNSGYGTEGMPEMNTTSYPKLIKALREALGAEKLLTVVDHLEPTAYFWDTTATGGIEVGQLLDYAWSGYRDNTISLQIVDPWHPDAVDSNGEKIVYEGTHKPFAGLAPAKYGCLNIPWSTGAIEQKKIYEWRQAGCKQSDILVFDLRTILQDQYESTWVTNLGDAYVGFADDGLTSSFELFPGFWMDQADNLYALAGDRLLNLDDPRGRKYDKWLKDW